MSTPILVAVIVAVPTLIICLALTYRAWIRRAAHRSCPYCQATDPDGDDA